MSALQTANRNLEEVVKRLKSDLTSQREADSKSVTAAIKEADALRDQQTALKQSLHKAESHNETLAERLRASTASVADLQDQLLHQQEETIFAQQELEEVRASGAGMLFISLAHTSTMPSVQRVCACVYDCALQSRDTNCWPNLRI